MATIVGWQVDAPSEAHATAEHSTLYPPRPILYYGDVEEEWGILGMDADEHSLGIVAMDLARMVTSGRPLRLDFPDEATRVESLVVPIWMERRLPLCRLPRTRNELSLDGVRTGDRMVPHL